MRSRGKCAGSCPPISTTRISASTSRPASEAADTRRASGTTCDRSRADRCRTYLQVAREHRLRTPSGRHRLRCQPHPPADPLPPRGRVRRDRRLHAQPRRARHRDQALAAAARRRRGLPVRPGAILRWKPCWTGSQTASGSRTGWPAIPWTATAATCASSGSGLRPAWAARCSKRSASTCWPISRIASSARARRSSAARLLSSLKRFYQLALRESWLRDDPTLNVDAPRQARRLPKSLTEEDMEGLLAAPDTATPLGLRDRAMLELLYACGLRVSELVSVGVAHSEDMGVVRISARAPKSGWYRSARRRSPGFADTRAKRARPICRPHREALFVTARGQR